MERNIKQAAEDRRVFTEVPDQHLQEDNQSNSSDEIDPRQLQQLMMNPQFAALFSKSNKLGMSCFNISCLDLNQEGVEIFQDEDQDDYDYIDLNNLPNDQQQFFCQDDFNDDSENQFLEFQDYHVEFNEDDVDQDDDEAIDSDYGDNLIDVYQNGGNEEDIKNYKCIHLMDKDYGNQLEEGEKFQCPETGAHFEFLDMCHRLKKLQTRRANIDRMLEEDERKKSYKSKQDIENSNISLKEKPSNRTTSEQKAVLQPQSQQTSHFVSYSIDERSKRQMSHKEESKELESQILSAKQKSANDNVPHHRGETNDIIQKIRESKVHKTKQNYVGKALPTENNLVTEEGAGVGTSFNNYLLGQFNTQDNRKQSETQPKKKTKTKERKLIEAIVNQQKQLEIESQKSSQVNHTLRQIQQVQLASKDISHNQDELLSYCTTETRDAGEKNKKKSQSGTKQIQLNNFFSNHSSNRNGQIPQFDNRTQLQMEALALNKEIINRQIQAQNIGQKGKAIVKKRETSTNTSKQRNQSTGAKTVTTSNKANQIQKLLINFYKNQQSHSRSSNTKGLQGGAIIESSSRKRTKEPKIHQGIGPKIIIGSAEKIPKHSFSNPTQEYQTVGGGTVTNAQGVKKVSASKIKKYKINKGGLIARGNTIDNRMSEQQQQYTTTTNSYAVGSHSTTVGVSSQNASRPGSAIKKKQSTPQNKIVKSSFVGVTHHHHPEIKNLLMQKGKVELKMKKERSAQQHQQQPIVVLNKSKDQIIHKKTQSVHAKTVLKNKVKNNLGIMSLDQNSLALEEILKHNIDTHQDQQYQTYHQGQDNTSKNQKKISNLLNSACSNKSRQKSHSKISVSSKSRQKQDPQKASFGTKGTFTSNFNPDQIKLDINSIIKKLSIKQVNPNPLAEKQSKSKHAKSHHQTQLSSVSHGLVASSIATEDKKVSRAGTESKRYNSNKDSCREKSQSHMNNNRASSKDSKNRASTKPSRIHHQPMNSNGAAPVVKPLKEMQLNHPQQQMGLLTGSSYDFRSDRCETVI